MNNDYSFSVASLEIIIALSAAFVMGALLCFLLRLLGRLFRGKPATAELQQANTKQVHLERTTPDKASPYPTNEDSGSEPFQAAFPEMRPELPVVERQPLPEPIPAPVNQLMGSSTYEADIDTLLRRGSSGNRHTALPQHNRNHDPDASFASRARASLTQTAPEPEPPASPSHDLPVSADETVDDLKKLEGIGPNIEQLLNQYGIYSYARLATLSRDQLRDVLTAGGNEFLMHDPKSWPYQAELAAKQNWERLREYQEFLIEGRSS